MKNKQNITFCCFLHPVRDVSLGRRNGIQQGTLHPVRDASLRDADGIYLLHFLPKDVFLTEYSLGNRNRYKLFISHS